MKLLCQKMFEHGIYSLWRCESHLLGARDVIPPTWLALSRLEYWTKGHVSARVPLYSDGGCHPPNSVSKK